MTKPTAEEVLAFARRVEPVYVLLRWRWATIGNPSTLAIPSAENIADTLQLHINCISSKCLGSYSGGLFAELDKEYDAVVYGMRIEGENNR